MAIVPVLSKVLELVIGKQLMQYLETNSSICKAQFGFRKGLSRTHAIISLVVRYLIVMVRGILLQSPSAILVRLLIEDYINYFSEHYNIREQALALFSSYLENGIIIDKKISDCLLVTCGVPQGSISCYS